MKYACFAAALATTWSALPAEGCNVCDARRSVNRHQRPHQSRRRGPFPLVAFNASEAADRLKCYLRSPGGSVLAAMKIADIVRKAGLTTRIPYRATCASACVLVFAAGVSRIADADSTIAVHSVGMRGQADVDQEMVENGGTLAATTLMARIMSSYGAPPSVVGKMVATPTDDASVLTLADLEAWNVKITRFVPAQETPRTGEFAPPRSDTQSSLPPIHPTPPMQPSGQALTTWSGNVMRIVETFGPQPWEEKVAYLRQKGSSFFKQCKAGGCYFEATYTGVYATIALYLTDGSGGRPVRQTWCVSDPNAWVRFCSEQGGGNWTMRFDGSDWHRV